MLKRYKSCKLKVSKTIPGEEKKYNASNLPLITTNMRFDISGSHQTDSAAAATAFDDVTKHMLFQIQMFSLTRKSTF